MICNQKRCTDLNVVGANPFMLARWSDISPQGLRNTERRIPQLDSIYGSKVVIVVRWSLIGLTLEAVHIRKERPATNTIDEFRISELTQRL